MNKITLRILSFLFAAFLPPDEEDNASGDGSGRKSKSRASYYDRLGLQKNCTLEEVRKAYKKKSLQFHPDKVAQFANSSDPNKRAKTKEEIQADFVKIQEAYECLSDPDRRDAYDVLGEQGEKMVNPADESSLFMLIEPQQMVYNLAHASFVDKTKLFIMVLLAVSIAVIGPILVCLKVDGNHKAFVDAKWVSILIPFFVFHGLQIIVLMTGLRWFEVAKTLCIIVTEIFLANKWDGTLDWDYNLILIPIYIHQMITFFKSMNRMYKASRDILRMVTLSYLEQRVLPVFNFDGDEEANDTGGDNTSPRYYVDLTDEEREEINKRYIIVQEAFGEDEADDASSTSDPEIKLLFAIGTSPEYQQAKRIQGEALSTMISTILFRIPFLVLLILKLDQGRDWNWFIVFIPFFVEFGWCACTSCCSCMVTMAQLGRSNEMFEYEEVVDEEAVGDTQQSHTPQGDIQQGHTPGNEDPLPTTMGTKSGEEVDTGKNEEKEEVDIGNNEDEEKMNNGKSAEGSTNNELPNIDSQLMEEQSRACNSCCSALCVIIFLILFVLKLNGEEQYDIQDDQETGDSPISAFWVAFQIFFVAGIVLCCCCCCIYSRPEAVEGLTGKKEESGDDNDDGLGTNEGEVNDSSPKVDTALSSISPSAPVDDKPATSSQSDNEDFDLD